jgi:general transcription factor 3C protein 4
VRRDSCLHIARDISQDLLGLLHTRAIKASSLTGEVLGLDRKITRRSNISIAGDCVFLRRVILQSRSDGGSQLVKAKALELEQLLQTMPLAGELSIIEECPACGSGIPFRDIRTATCQNEHPWGKCSLSGFFNGFTYSSANAPVRCSITTLVLATSQVRTCLGCTRKAFSPVQSGLGGHPSAVVESELVAGILRAATRCSFCGNRFVYLL